MPVRPAGSACGPHLATATDRAFADGGHALDFIGRGAFEEAGEVRYRVGQGHTVVEVNLDGDAQAELAFRLGTVVHLTEQDFLL